MRWDIRDGKIGTSTFTPEVPFGGYIEQPYSRDFTTSEMEELDVLVDSMQESKQNVAYIRANSTMSNTNELIRWLSQAGIGIIMEPNDAGGEQAILDRFGEIPFVAILNHDDQGSPDHSLNDIVNRYNFLRSSYPNLPVYSTGERTSPEAMTKRSFGDVIAQQAYQSGREDPIGSTADLYVNGRVDGKPNLANCQAFIGYENEFPTPEEMEAYFILGLIYREGICAYTYYSPDLQHNIRAYSFHWQKIKDLSVFVHNNRRVIATGHRTIERKPNSVQCYWNLDPVDSTYDLFMEASLVNQPTFKTVYTGV